MAIDTFFLLMLSLTGFLTAGAILLVMSLPVEDRAADAARAKGLLDPSSADGTFNPLPIHYRFFHPATTAHWRQRGFLPLLMFARVLFAGSFVAGLGALIWLASA